MCNNLFNYRNGLLCDATAITVYAAVKAAVQATCQSNGRWERTIFDPRHFLNPSSIFMHFIFVQIAKRQTAASHSGAKGIKNSLLLPFLLTSPMPRAASFNALHQK